MKYRTLLGLLFLIPGAFFSYGQSLTSSVAGIVRDNASRKGVEGAFIYLVGGDSLTAITDASGRFSIENVKPGRYICSVHSLGYETDEQEALVITGKTSIIEFNLIEKVTELETLTVQARPTNNTETSAISLPIEKVMRMPANFFDPVRMLSSYPGVVTTNDQANNIVVKGNSPTGLLWRLNGMDIVNPNHLANAGTFNDKPTANGGGVNILSAQMLDRTDFYSGTMPARYGNLTSAALDMTLRNGNSRRREYTAQASLIGLDFAAEGPMGRKGRTSYLANARYSTVGLLSNMGVNFGDEKINFQDFSFNINSLVGQRGGSISFFGFGGVSRNEFYAKTDSTEWEKDKDRFTIIYNNITYALGTRLDLPLKKSFTFSSGLTFSGNDQDRESTSIGTPRLPVQRSNLDTNRKLLSGFASITGKWSPKLSGEFGAMVNYNRDQLSNYELLPFMQTDAAGTSSYVLVQPYGQLSFRTGKFLAVGGLRYMYSTFGQSALDPRINLQYQVTLTQNFYVTGGQMSQMLPAGIYMTQPKSTARNFLQKKFLEVGHMIQFETWKLNSSVYYHFYDRVPVSQTSAFSALNYIEGTVFEQLVPVGTGNNQGVALQAERSFVEGYYLLTGASVYRSTYVAGDNLSRPTKFDGRYSLMVTGGREWLKQVNEHNRSFGIHGRLMYLGGLRDTPIDENMSRSMGVTTYQQDTYSVMLKDYVRVDLRVSWRKDKKNYTRTIALDVQNVAGIKNEAYRYYDAFLGKVVTQYQVGFIPVLVYRVDF
ncbi:MAG TPA: TonB-dependent receptor [Cyclobacteriaceae bacterium]|nr:TonB-dependent receptor [Cyclobacteriaceae bacterium]